MRLLQLINSTITYKRFIGTYSLHGMVTCIDAEHSIHSNMRGHTGVCIYFVTVVVHARLTKHKSNTSST